MVTWHEIKARVTSQLREPKDIHATALVGYLHGLHWWLADDVLDIAKPVLSNPTDGSLAAVCNSGRFPTLPEETGACWIIYALEKANSYPLLRRACCSRFDGSPNLAQGKIEIIQRVYQRSSMNLQIK